MKDARCARCGVALVVPDHVDTDDEFVCDACDAQLEREYREATS